MRNNLCCMLLAISIWLNPIVFSTSTYVNVKVNMVGVVGKVFRMNRRCSCFAENWYFVLCLACMYCIFDIVFGLN